MKDLTIIGALCLALFTQSANAEWFEATGQAVIEQGDMSSARQAAMHDAVKRAALVAGASVNSSLQVVNGILQSEQFDIASSNEIRQLQLMSESQSGNMLTVTVRVDIDVQDNSCAGNTYRKPLLLSQVQLQARQDATHGQLFNLGADTTTVLEKHLRDYAPAARVQQLEHSMDTQQLVYPVTEQLFNQGNQYVLLGKITDLSLGQTNTMFWQAEEKERFFAIDISLFDLFEQTIVYQQEYRTSASWRLSNKAQLQSHSQAFWQAPYGHKIDQVLQAIAEDVQQQLQCKSLLISINQTENNQIMLQLGKANGLQIGDSVQVNLLQRHPTSPGIKRVVQDQLTLSITEVTEQHAWATSPDAKLIQHVRKGDIVSVRKSSGF